MTGYLLDTNVLSDLIRDPAGPVFRRLSGVGEADLATSVIVASELRFGAARRGSAELSRRVEAVLERIAVLAFGAPADAVYARLRRQTEAAGVGLGAMDLLIAAHALATDRTLISADAAFVRVDGLRVENWRAEAT